MRCLSHSKIFWPQMDYVCSMYTVAHFPRAASIPPHTKKCTQYFTTRCSHHEERAAVELSVSGHDSRCFGSECVVGEPGPGEVPSCSTPSVMTRFWNCCWRCFRKTSHLVRLGGRG